MPSLLSGRYTCVRPNQVNVPKVRSTTVDDIKEILESFRSDLTKLCLNCGTLSDKHVADDDIMNFHCPYPDGGYYIKLFFKPVSNLEYMQHKHEQKTKMVD